MMKHVLLVPGAAGAAAFWDPIVARLPAAWRVRAIDLPGLGSIPTRSDVGSYDDLVNYVAPTITAPAVVVAQSMGAFIALQLTLRYPQLVTHVVLVAATAGIDIASHGGADWRDGYPSAFPHAQAWACTPVPDLSSQLGQIHVPVLLLWPTRDQLSPLSVASALASTIPSTTLVTFDSDDHWIVHRFPDQAAAAIRSFID
jgi:2-hydroxy-6-oxonona-2,4-dienedioate hydrolase